MENQSIMTEGRSVVAWGVEEGLQRIWENLLEWWKGSLTWFSSVQFSQSIVSNSLWPHGLQNTRLPCLSPTPGAYSNSCPSSPWCHPTISSSVVPFSSCPQSLPASESFPMSQFFASGGQSIGISASASVLPVNIQDWFYFRTDWLDLLAVPGTLKESSPIPQFKSIHSSVLNYLYSPTLIYIQDYWKNYSFD